MRLLVKKFRKKKKSAEQPVEGFIQKQRANVLFRKDLDPIVNIGLYIQE